MRKAPTAKGNHSPSLKGRVPWVVVAVDALDGYRLAVRFMDGTQGEVDVSRLIHSPDAGVFARLRDAAAFRAVGIDHGAVTWAGDLDLAPDAMYEEIKAAGRWTPE
jgi:hypothetical protein